MRGCCAHAAVGVRACPAAAAARSRRRGGALALRCVPRPRHIAQRSSRHAPPYAAAQPDQQQPPLPAPAVLVGGSTVLYAGLAAAAAGLAHVGGAAPVLPALFAPPPLTPTLAFTAPLCVSLVAALAGVAAGVPACVEIKTLMDKSITPLLQKSPLPALALLAAGAGYGEEAMFRGALLPLAMSALAAAGLDAGAAAAVALAATSVVFGALHAVTPLYFVWATAAGALFGYEWLATGGSLSACAATHALYDFIAFIAIVRAWGPQAPLPPAAASSAERGGGGEAPAEEDGAAALK
jgi:membrane protease YdiL (CAAX protease family)